MYLLQKDHIINVQNLHAQTSFGQGIPNYPTQTHECVAALSPRVSALSRNGAPPSRDEVLEHARPACL